MGKREEIAAAYDFGPVPQEKGTDMEFLRQEAKRFALAVYDHCPDNRARALALTNLQQAKMWSVQSVVDG